MSEKHFLDFNDFEMAEFVSDVCKGMNEDETRVFAQYAMSVAEAVKTMEGLANGQIAYQGLSSTGLKFACHQDKLEAYATSETSPGTPIWNQIDELLSEKEEL